MGLSCKTIIGCKVEAKQKIKSGERLIGQKEKSLT